MTTLSPKEMAEFGLEMFNAGAILTSSAHLGFDIEEPMTQGQAEKFHKFVLPLISKQYNRVKGDEKKEEEMKNIYLNSSPVEFLKYLLKEEVEAI